MDRKVRAGETISLKARFQDDLGENVQADNVWLRIFPAEADVNNPAEAVLSSGNATYFGDGIFYFDYTVPGIGPDGIWFDQWYGDIPSQQLYANLEFEVGASGVISSFENQLTVNNLVEVTLYSGIRAKDGGWLQEDYSFSFLTETSPTYANTRKIRLDYGGFLADLEEDALQLSLLEASIEADELTWQASTNSKVFQHARREWVTCKAATILLSNLGTNVLKSKSLGDLSVTYDTEGLRDSLNKAINCLNRWEAQVMTGGFAKAVQNPQMVIKGSLDPDRPPSGRLWHDSNTSPIPAANTKAKFSVQRRYKSIYSARKKFW